MPGIPSFLFDVPEGWIIDEGPSALCVVRRPQGVDGFWKNAIIRHDKVPREVDFERAAKTTWAKLKRTYPELRNRASAWCVSANVVAYVRGVELIADGRPPRARSRRCSSLRCPRAARSSTSSRSSVPLRNGEVQRNMDA